jgi:hypothetical protein
MNLCQNSVIHSTYRIIILYKVPNLHPAPVFDFPSFVYALPAALLPTDPTEIRHHTIPNNDLQNRQ